MVENELHDFKQSSFMAINDTSLPSEVLSPEYDEEELFPEPQSSAMRDSLHDLNLTTDNLAHFDKASARRHSTDRLNDTIHSFMEDIDNEVTMKADHDAESSSDVNDNADEDASSDVSAHEPDQYDIDIVYNEAEEWYQDKNEDPPFTIHTNSRANGVGCPRTVLSTSTNEEVEMTFCQWLSTRRGY